MLNYSLELALFDYLPVTFSAVGFYFIAHYIAQQQPQLKQFAFFSVFLIVLGGLCKASWKLIIAASGINLAWLNNCLFILMMPGFFLLCYCFWLARPQVQGVNTANWKAILLPLLVVGGSSLYFGISAPDQRVWFFILLAGVTLSSTVFSIFAIRACLYGGLYGTAGLFSVNLIANYVMAGLARTGDYSEGMQWLEQSINTASQLVFCLAAWLMYRFYRFEQNRLSVAY